MSKKHSVAVRGMSPEFEGRFGRMFPELPAATFTEASLLQLGAAMVAEFDPAKNGQDAEESGIPALYTYLGQFIDHDLTFDPESSFQKQKDPEAKTDFRNPAFDLDNIYGRGPADQPYMYQDDGKSFMLGDPLTLGDEGAHDLYRSPAGRALIGDPRNDENAIVSQLQGLVHRFHNRVVKENPGLDFKDAQKVVRNHYQHVVIHDFLGRVVKSTVLADLKTNGDYDKSKIRFYKPKDCPFMPFEFSVAAYRFGHSMVRPGYRLNDATLLPIFPIQPEKKVGFPEGLTGFRRMISDWGIDWARFIDIEIRDYGVDPDLTKHKDCALTDAEDLQNFKRLQLAYRIDTSLVDPLGHLPASVAGDAVISLAARNLLRGLQFGLPSGQAVADAMGIPRIPNEAIFIGQAVDNPGNRPTATEIDPSFAGNCPLWTYILAEAAQNQAVVNIPVTGSKSITTPQLGPVGGRIVAEVFLGLMFADPGSILNTGWRPGNANYALKDFVRFALGR